MDVYSFFGQTPHNCGQKTLGENNNFVDAQKYVEGNIKLVLNKYGSLVLTALTGLK
jgi:hypothetical protein